MNVDEGAVTAILVSKSHYETLCVELDADDSSIKKQYKQIALIVHPDKNAAPRADEAFKMLRTAFECLSDPLKRKEYDKSISGNKYLKRPRRHETDEERKKRREDLKQRKEEETERNREEAEAFCAAAAERMDRSRNNWQQFQSKAFAKKKRP